MVEHWRKIGFAPTEFMLDDDLDTENDVEIKDSDKFTPQKKELTEKETTRFTGIILKNLPIALPDKDIIEVLIEAGAPTASNFQIHRPEGAHKASAEINNLDSQECKNIIDQLQGKIINGNKVFCRGSSDLHTPKKNENEEANNDPEKDGNNATYSIPNEPTLTNTKTKGNLNTSNNEEQTPTTTNIEGQNPTKPTVQTIPGLPAEALSLTKSQIKKMKKNSKMKSAKNSPQLDSLDPATQKALAQYNLSEFDFDDSEEDSKSNDSKVSVNDIVDKLEKREEKKRGRSSPGNDERKTRHKSVAL